MGFHLEDLDLPQILVVLRSSFCFEISPVFLPKSVSILNRLNLHTKVISGALESALVVTAKRERDVYHFTSNIVTVERHHHLGAPRAV